MRIILVFFVLALAWMGVEARSAQSDDGIILRMCFRIPDQSASDLLLLLKRYAAENGYSFQNVGEIMPHKYIAKPFLENLTQNDTQIVVSDIGTEGQMLLVIRGARDNSTKHATFAPLLDKIRARWPDLHAYLGP